MKKKRKTESVNVADEMTSKYDSICGKVGIGIPKECGYTEGYETTGIMYHDERCGDPGQQYLIFITKEDFEANNPYLAIMANMKLELLLANESPGDCMKWCIEPAFIHVTQDHKAAIIISELVAEVEGTWNKRDFPEEDYKSFPRMIRIPYMIRLHNKYYVFY